MVTHVSDTVCEQIGEEEFSGEGNSHQLSDEQVTGCLCNLQIMKQPSEHQQQNSASTLKRTPRHWRPLRNVSLCRERYLTWLARAAMSSSQAMQALAR